MYTDFVLDIETTNLDTCNPFGVIQIGVAAINRHNYNLPTLVHSSIVTVSDYTYDTPTIEWWQQTNKEYFNFLKTNNSAVDLYEALSKLNTFIEANTSKQFGLLGVWGNGSIFDNAKLLKGYSHFNLKPAWTYKHDACLRTLLNLHPEINILKASIIREVTEAGADKPHWHVHNAEFDAVYESVLLQEVFSLLKGIKL